MLRSAVRARLGSLPFCQSLVWDPREACLLSSAELGKDDVARQRDDAR